MHFNSHGSKVLAACWHMTNIAIFTNCKLGCSATVFDTKTKKHFWLFNHVKIVLLSCNNFLFSSWNDMLKLFCGSQHLWKREMAKQATIKCQCHVNLSWKCSLEPASNHVLSFSFANLTASLCGMAFWFLHAPFSIVSILHLSLSFLLVWVVFFTSIYCVPSATKKMVKWNTKSCRTSRKCFLNSWSCGDSVSPISSFNVSLWLLVAASCKQTHSINTIVLMALILAMSERHYSN